MTHRLGDVCPMEIWPSARVADGHSINSLLHSYIATRGHASCANWVLILRQGKFEIFQISK
jgi:hypothetical protein